ncbi:hypothetical protein H310_12908 [Aphanomyces invadans]|uniref:Uncharacterized protein n=1 Tax=Aphanomyces invadans TaxID=157072 RepID=A0A024TFF4_9STRA|nr:hypothetical protein H310_12908 [Aphanomyces invadans]ETV92875.1 hypothetical protein H310_12908 [Aphanomyces invadans]|eukprot:XP_008878396.1 hypothetical protein H310_12908 [Aphanomyces invadans]
MDSSTDEEYVPDAPSHELHALTTVPPQTIRFFLDPHRVTTGRELADGERKRLYNALRKLKANGAVPRGSMKALCAEYGVTQQAVSIIWQL